MTYTVTQNGIVIRDSDGAFIPSDPANSDYTTYLAWVAAGNTATPCPVVTSQLSAQELADAIDGLVASIYSNWTRFQQEYLLREQAAQAFKDAGYAGDPGTWVSAYATSAGVTNQAAADTILAQASMLNGALKSLGALRMRKYEVIKAANAITAQAVYDDIVAQTNAVAATIQ
jgi:hypothetical protein